MANILVVDDDVRVCKMIEAVLKGQGHFVVTANNGTDGLEQATKLLPDLLILDVMMPDLNGFEVCRRLRSSARLSDVPVMFLTGRGMVDDRIEGFEAGADDYLVKPFDLREMELRVEALLRRSGNGKKNGNGATPKQLEAGGMRLDMTKYQVEVNGRTVQLTPVEFELLHYLMSRAGEVVSAEKLLQEVWRYYPGTGDPTVVRMQIMNLRNKIEPTPKSPKYIRTRYRHGYYVPA
ncbi:MAG: response regulator transcription factor [Chloroflexi bacterium]|nr:response regulator transcription factor [Chloroflexota bacterium]